MKIFFLIGIHSIQGCTFKAEEPLQTMQLKEKEDEEKDEKNIGKPIRKNKDKRRLLTIDLKPFRS